jgi:uncharacterized protein (DUF3820 family)
MRTNAAEGKRNIYAVPPPLVNVAKLLKEARAKERTERHELSPRSPVEDSVSDEDTDAVFERLQINEETDYLLSSQQMRCGKYRGRTFDWIAKNDKNYCRWLHTLTYPTGSLGQLLKWLKANDKKIVAAQLKEAREAQGKLSKRVFLWDIEQFMELGLLPSFPTLKNCYAPHSKRNRAPIFSAETAGLVPPWDPKITTAQKTLRNQKSRLLARFVNYVFRRMVHVVREDSRIDEPLTVDLAMRVLQEN